MNDSRIDSVLKRQKRSVLKDAAYTVVLLLGILVYVFALGSPTARAAATAPASSATQPATPDSDDVDHRCPELAMTHAPEATR